MNRKVVIGLIIGCCVIAALGMSFKSSDGLTTVDGALTVTGDVTIGGVTRSDWPSSGGGSAPVGTVVNAGASTIGAIPRHTDVTGTNTEPSLLSVTGTNGSLPGIFSSHELIVSNSVSVGSSAPGTITFFNGASDIGGFDGVNFYGSGSGLTNLNTGIARDQSILVISNTLTSSNLFSFTIPAGLLTNRPVYVDLSGLLLNNTGTSLNYILSATLGSTTLFSANALAGAATSGASQRPWKLKFMLSANTSTSEFWQLDNFLGSAAAAISSNPGTSGFSVGTATENAANALTFTVAVTPPTNIVTWAITRYVANAYAP